MKKIVYIFFLFFNFSFIKTDDISFSMENFANKHSKLKCLFLALSDDKFFEKFCRNLQYDLEFTDQLDIELQKTKNKLEDRIEKKLFDKGISICGYLEKVSSKKINIVLKDSCTGSIIFSKKFGYNSDNFITDVHKISEEILLALTGESGIFLNSLAYTKTLGPKHKVICVSDYSCKIEKTVVPTKKINVAPCWHSQAPVLFYSQFTNVNNRLMSINLKNQKSTVICSFEGLNMQPSFSKDGTQSVLCLSGGKNSELYLYDQKICNKKKEKIYIKLTNNGGNNSSPTLLDNGDIIFCSDFETKNPQIYYLDRKNNKTIRLTNGHGYCAAPSYCQKNNSIVYTRMINGTFQLFSLKLNNLSNIQEKQLTFGAGDKHEPCISNCGRFIAFSYECEDKFNNKAAQIAVFNTNSNNIKILTSGKESKSFPKWGKEFIL